MLSKHECLLILAREFQRSHNLLHTASMLNLEKFIVLPNSDISHFEAQHTPTSCLPVYAIHRTSTIPLINHRSTSCLVTTHHIPRPRSFRMQSSLGPSSPLLPRSSRVSLPSLPLLTFPVLNDSPHFSPPPSPQPSLQSLPAQQYHASASPPPSLPSPCSPISGEGLRCCCVGESIVHPGRMCRGARC